MTPGPDPHAGPVDLHSTRTRNLLSYLALHPDRPGDRRQCAFLLWPDGSDATALRHMRQHLHRLRQLFHDLGLPPEILVTRGGQIQLNPDAGLWIDVHLFRRFAGDRRRQIEAIELYEGDLLVGNDADWLRPIRERLQEQYLRALRTQIDAAKMARNYPRALYYADRLLQVAPYRESAHRIYMEALYFNDRRAEALRQFERLRTLLAERFDARPMTETVALHRQIKAGSLPHDLPFLVTSSREVPGTLERITRISSALVGRRDALAELDGGLARAVGGAGSAILIEGAFGLGKSTLLDTWQAARATRTLTFCGRGRDDLERRPFGVVLEALREKVREIDWTWFPVQFPHLATFRRVLASPGDCDPPASSLGVEQLGQWLLMLAARAERPLTLIIDDLHRVDGMSWELLAYLAHRCERYPLLIIGSYRQGALSTAATSLFHNLQRHRRFRMIQLWPFTRGESVQLATQRLGYRPAARVANTLYRATEGNPFYLVESLKTTPPEDLDTAAARLAGDVLPASVRCAVEARLASLDEESRALLARAAAHGRLFTFDALVEAMPGYDEQQYLQALEAGLQKGLLKEHSEGYEFTHRLDHLVIRAQLLPDPR